MKKKFQAFLNFSVLFSLILSNISGGPGVGKALAKSANPDLHQTIEFFDNGRHQTISSWPNWLKKLR